MQKPQSIQRFDIAYLASVAVYIASFFLGFDDTVALTRAEYAKAGMNIEPSGLITGTFVVVLAISLLLWWLVSSKANNIAKWIITIFFVLGLVIAAVALAMGSMGPLTIATGLGLLSTALSGVGIYFLFQSDAKAWLEREKPQR